MMSINLVSGTKDDVNVFVFGIYSLAVEHHETDRQRYYLSERDLLMLDCFGPDCAYTPNQRTIGWKLYLEIRQTLSDMDMNRNAI